MSQSKPAPQLGQVVRIMRGRETDKFAVVIAILDERFVHIADGDKRKFDQPKKKNVQHLQLQPEISREVADSIRETGRVTNGKLRYALARFAERREADAQQRGE